MKQSIKVLRFALFILLAMIVLIPLHFIFLGEIKSEYSMYLICIIGGLMANTAEYKIFYK